MVQLKLAKELEEYRNVIESSKLDFIEIQTNNVQPNIFQSKFGGNPFLPIGVEYPKNKIGIPMVLLAQINFSELPENDIFSKKGILQFYISGDDLFGKNYDNLIQSDFKVLFFEEYENIEYENDFDFVNKIEQNSPIDKEYGLEFTATQGFVPCEDLRFKNYFGVDSFDFFESLGEKGDKLGLLYSKAIECQGHKLGGYGFFVQEDPRENIKGYEDYVLLLQIDSDSEGIQWGDVGSGQFLIDKNDLDNLDFSKVLYYWNCF